MTPRTKLSHEFEMTEKKCTETFLHYSYYTFESHQKSLTVKRQSMISRL